MPMTTSQSPVVPLMSLEGLLCTFMTFKSRVSGATSRPGPLAILSVQWDDDSVAPSPLEEIPPIMAEIKVLSSIATKEAYLELVPQFERASGHKVSTTWAGTTAIMQRMAAGERYDLIVISSTELDQLTKQGTIVARSRVDLA